jgi:hypothetical protein
MQGLTRYGTQDWLLVVANSNKSERTPLPKCTRQVIAATGPLAHNGLREVPSPSLNRCRAVPEQMRPSAASSSLRPHGRRGAFDAPRGFGHEQPRPAPRHAFATTTRPTVVCIAGNAQNGATMLSRALKLVPGWLAIGEVGYVWDRGILENYPCGCGVAFADCEFWREVGARAFGGWSPESSVRRAGSCARVSCSSHVPSAIPRHCPC